MNTRVLVGTLIALSACSADAAPERRCSAHSQCDNGFLCGSDGLCRPSAACSGDDDCCPGAVCFSGWCRPTPECIVGRACPGLGDVCEVMPGLAIAGAPGPLGDANAQGRCVPAPCDALGGCVEPFACVANRCILGVLCDGRCTNGEVCEPTSGRCLVAPGPCDCVVGTPVASQLQTTPLACGPGTYACDCAVQPPIDNGLPGVDGRLVPSDSDTPGLVSYEPAFGDLVLSRWGGDPNGVRQDMALDGVPTTAASAAGSYRGGVLEPGPDRGARPSIAIGSDYDILYRDLDRQRQMYVHAGLDGVRGASYELPIDGLEVGRYSCIVRRPDGPLGGLVFVSRDPSDSVALLLRVESRGPDPLSADDWAVTTVVETPLPLRSQMPCANACGFGETCVVANGSERCAGVVSLGGGDCGDCGAHRVCSEVDSVRACHDRVYGRYEADRLPFGEGLFASCAVDGGDIYAAWYDADARRLIAARWPFGASERVVVDEGVGKDPGRFASIAVRGTQVGIAYQDLAQATLNWARTASWGAPFVREVVPTGDAGEPGVGARAFFVNDTPVIVHLDGRRAQVELLARANGCWGREVVLQGGGYAYPDGLAGNGGVWVSGQALRFDDALAPHHAPVIVWRSLPSCP